MTINWAALEPCLEDGKGNRYYKTTQGRNDQKTRETQTSRFHGGYQGKISKTEKLIQRQQKCRAGYREAGPGDDQREELKIQCPKMCASAA